MDKLQSTMSDVTNTGQNGAVQADCDVIEIKGLKKAFGKLKVLEGIDLTLNSPGITAILGPNASGKTTLIKCVLGMVIPDDGSIQINDANVIGKYEYRDRISYLPQIARFPENLRVREMLKMVESLRKRPSRVDELIAYYELEEVLNQRLGHLSGGTRQKINLVMALMYDNPVLILDEPSSGLDPIALLKTKDLIMAERAKGKQILITTHIMSLVEELADVVLFLLDGHIHFHGTPEDLRKQYGEEDLERCIARMLAEQGQNQDGHA